MRGARALWFWICLGLFGCGAAADPTATAGKADGVENPLCIADPGIADPGIADPEPGTICNVQQVDCQRRIWRALACVHPQVSGELPPISFVADPDAATDAELAAVQNPYLTGPDLVLEALGVPTREATRAGFSNGRKVVLDDAATSNADDPNASVWWMYALAHEYVHVVQGRGERLHADFWSSRLDQLMAVEGEAELFAMLTLRRLGFDVDIATAAATSNEQLSKLASESFGQATAILPYRVGLRLMFEAHERSGWEGVLDTFYNTPSIYSVLYKAWSPPPPGPDVRCVASADVTEVDDVGVWQAIGLLGAAGVPDPVAAAKPFHGGQAFARLQQVEGGYIVTARWRLRWQSAGYASLVHQFLARAFADDPHRTVALEGADVIVSGTTGEPSWSPDPLPLRCQAR